MRAWYNSHRGWLRLLTLGSWCLVGCQEPEGGTLMVTWFGTAGNPVQEVRVVAGLRGEVGFLGTAFVSTGGDLLESETVGIPGEGLWPLRAVLVDASGDTLAEVRTELQLGPGYRHQVFLTALPNRNGAFICSATQDRAPIRRPDRNPPDTLYMNYLALEPGKFPPVC